MARMSRRERFAEKRERMANNREESLVTNDLDKYAERLKQLNEGFGDDLQKLLSRREENVVEKKSDFVIPSFEEAKDELNNVGEQFHDFLKELDIDKLNKNIDELIGLKEKKPIEVTQEPQETKPEPVVNVLNEEVIDETSKNVEEENNGQAQEEAELVDNTSSDNESKENTIVDFEELDKEINIASEEYEDDINRLIDELLKDKEEHINEPATKEEDNPNQDVEVINQDTPIVVLPVKEAEKPVIEIKKTIINPVNEDDVVSNLQDIIGPVALYVKKEKPVYVPKVEPVIEEPVKEEVQEGLPVEESPVEEKPVEELPVEETIVEEKPIEELPVENNDEQDGTITITNGNYLDEAIKEANDYNHQEGNKTLDELKDEFYKKEKVEEAQEENKEKIDEEFSNTVTLEIDKVLGEVQKTLEESKEETTIIQNIEDLAKEEVFEHPVLTKKEEVNDGLEILPMEETLKLDVVDDTIPFTALEAEEEDDDDDEDSGFGKIINIILIVLIVVLLAIIGIIGYFLLAANGVI